MKIYTNIDYSSKDPFFLGLKMPNIEEYIGRGKVEAEINGIEEKNIKIDLIGNSSIHCIKTLISSVKLHILGKGSANFGEVKSVHGDISKGLSSLSVPKNTDLSGLKKDCSSSIFYH